MEKVIDSSCTKDEILEAYNEMFELNKKLSIANSEIKSEISRLANANDIMWRTITNKDSLLLKQSYVMEKLVECTHMFVEKSTKEVEVLENSKDSQDFFNFVGTLDEQQWD